MLTSWQHNFSTIYLYTERSSVEKAQSTMEDEDLLNVLTRLGSLQKPKFIVDCFSLPMSHIELKLLDRGSVFSLYEKDGHGRNILKQWSWCCLRESRQPLIISSIMWKILTKPKLRNSLDSVLGPQPCVKKKKNWFVLMLKLGSTEGVLLVHVKQHLKYQVHTILTLNFAEFDKIFSSYYLEMEIF